MSTFLVVFSSILSVLFVVLAAALVLVILVQRPQGGGLSGAFGAGGGASQSAFGAKTGDVLTIVTVAAFVLFLLVAIGRVLVTQAMFRDNEAILPPAAPTALAVTATGDGAARLTWTDQSTDEAGFRVLRATGESEAFDVIDEVGADVIEYLDNEVEPGQTYYYQVQAFGDGGNSALTARVRLNVPAADDAEAAETPGVELEAPVEEAPVDESPAGRPAEQPVEEQPTDEPTDGSAPQPTEDEEPGR